MKVLIDVHTHTISSGHAYSTLQENVQVAKEKGLKYYGMSDHGPQLPSASHIYHICNLGVIPKYIDGVRVLKGCEANILKNGEIDLPDWSLNHVDYLIASLHGPCYDINTSMEDNMKAYEKVMQHPLVKVIGHPDDGNFQCDYDKLVYLAKKYHVLIELNNSSLNPSGFRKNSKQNDYLILKACQKYACPIIMNSDAHISFDVGKLDYAKELLAEVNFPNELVVNYNENLIEEYFLK